MAQDSYYSSASPGAAQAPETARPTRESDEGGGDNVALLPKAFFPPDKPLKVGNECTVKIEEVQDDQVLVSYSHSPAQQPSREAAAAPVDKEMSAYMASSWHRPRKFCLIRNARLVPVLPIRSKSWRLDSCNRF